MARKKNTIGCLFYVALVLLVLVVFLFNRTRVQQVMEKTGFARLFQRKPAAPVEVVVAPPQEQSGGGQDQPPAQKAPSEVVVDLAKPPAQEQGAGAAEQAGAAGGNARQEPPAAPPPGASAPAKAPAKAPPPSLRTRQARLFFVAVKPDGGIQLKSVIRAVKYADAPLTSTIEALLSGPTPAEVNRGLISLVAPEARLRGARVKDGTAYLDFSEAFRFNSLGKEGLSAQLQQVVYSATEFPTVKQVQILLEGGTADYLGPEGLFIGKPLSRESFQR